MELTLSRETLCFERLALSQREQVSVEGEATLPGSMRDAVTVLSVQAQAYLEKAEAVAGGVKMCIRDRRRSVRRQPHGARNREGAFFHPRVYRK